MMLKSSKEVIKPVYTIECTSSHSSDQLVFNHYTNKAPSLDVVIQ